MNLHVDSAEHVSDHGEPILRLAINGNVVDIGLEDGLLKYSHVHLPGYERRLAPCNCPGNRATGVPVTQRLGYTNDTTIVRLFADFRQAVMSGRFVSGPVSIPVVRSSPSRLAR